MNEFLEAEKIKEEMQDGTIDIKKLNNYIKKILLRVSEQSSRLTETEKEIYVQYLEEYFIIASNEYYDTTEMAELFKIIEEISIPKLLYKVIDISREKEMSNFFEEQYKKNDVTTIYKKSVNKIIDKINTTRKISLEEYKRYDYIYKILSYGINHEHISREIEFLSKIGNEFDIDSKTVENVIEITIDQENTKSPQISKTIIEYYKNHLSKPAKDIISNSALSHLIRAAQLNKLPLEMSEQIIELLEQRNREHSSPNMERYEIKIENGIEMNSEEYEKFIEQVAEIRLQKGAMPQEYSGYILKQAIISGKVPKNKGIIERALEELTEKEIENTNAKKINARVVEQEIFGNAYLLGGCQDDIIKISRKYLDELGIIRTIETITHESTHITQRQHIKQNKVDKKEYIMLKERIINSFYPGFYKNNYEKMHIEIYARMEGYKRRIEILKRIGLSEKQINELGVEDFKRVLTGFTKEKKIAKYKVIENKMQDVDKIFDDIIKDNEEILEIYPILNAEYEIVGNQVQRKSYAEILKQYEEELNEAKDSKDKERISNLYTEILFRDVQIPEDRQKQELEELNLIDSNNAIIIRFREEIIQKKFPKQKISRVLSNKVKTMLESLKNLYDKTTPTQKQEAELKFRKLDEKINQKESEKEM